MMEKEIGLRISFRGYWFIGSGHEAGAYADDLMLKDSEGFPFVPGKTLKGIFRNAATLAEHNGLISHVSELFGMEGTTIVGRNFIENPRLMEMDFSELTTAGILGFTNAELPLADRRTIAGSENGLRHLFRTIQNTKIDRVSGTAKDGSLRTTEVCVPLTLRASVTYDEKRLLELFSDIRTFREKLDLLCSLIGEIGGRRRRGFGKCTVEAEQ